MKRFVDMDDNEFQVLRRVAEKKPLSEFPRYCKRLEGYEFYLRGRRVWKWELFDWGYRDEEMLKGNETDIQAVNVIGYDLDN